METQSNQTTHQEMDLSSPQAASLIAAQNDAFRKTAMDLRSAPDIPLGRIVMTSGISQQSPEFKLELMRKVTAFETFDEDCDPYNWHEMGVIEMGNEKIWFKIDLYDVAYQHGAADPTDPQQTRRVLTLLFPSEY